MTLVALEALSRLDAFDGGEVSTLMHPATSTTLLPSWMFELTKPTPRVELSGVVLNSELLTRGGRGMRSDSRPRFLPEIIPSRTLVQLCVSGEFTHFSTSLNQDWRTLIELEFELCGRCF